MARMQPMDSERSLQATLDSPLETPVFNFLRSSGLPFSVDQSLFPDTLYSFLHFPHKLFSFMQTFYLQDSSVCYTSPVDCRYPPADRNEDSSVAIYLQ